ncbi:MAG TPA: hypothetical protein DCY03_21310 [Planctomycetaceae bacterium]|nr:hypothetical protein [Planctomycetaceae bacterium]
MEREKRDLTIAITVNENTIYSFCQESGQRGTKSLAGCIQATRHIKDVLQSVYGTVKQMSFF